ncbi:hypothetical protein [Cupriavidus pauculus]|uniref:hypothetical protein n=1 Tax=Cupriavidus pauculus TaxID=82633 RepID=UPI001EE219F2|nr:hypothetical protein [Cupriavidus pauculus]GJG94861.1 hypothetical protein CBA19C6_10250 [Cupriavidus pauculus]
MTRNQQLGRKLETAVVAFATGFSAHGQTSSSLGLLAGTLAVCALVARSTFTSRSSTVGLVLLPQG